jgi:hypothetical protein
MHISLCREKEARAEEEEEFFDDSSIVLMYDVYPDQNAS